MSVKTPTSLFLLVLAGGLAALASDSSTDAAAQRAMQEIQAGDFQSAKKLLREQLRAKPAAPDLWNLMGIVEGELHEQDAAKQAFERGLTLSPQSIGLHENIGLLVYKNGKYPEAKQYLARAVELGSQSPGVRFTLAGAELRTGEYDKALTDLRTLEPMLGGASDYWEERGRAELIKDAAAAEASFVHALSLSPESLPALNGAALAAEKQGADEKALSYLIRARQANGKDVSTLEHFAEVCIRRDLGPDAKAALEEARSLAPSDNSVLYLLSRANISIQNWQEAFDLFSQLAKRVPNFAPSYYAMGWIDIRLNRLEDAKKQLQQCLLLAPEMAGPALEQAQLELNDGELDAAEKLVRKVLAQIPHDARANTILGDIVLRRGDLEQAQSCFETAIRDDPKLAAAHYKLSVILFRKHQAEKAAGEQQVAAQLDQEAEKASKTQLRLVLPDMPQAVPAERK